MSKISVEKLHQFSGHKDCVYCMVPADTESSFFSSGGDGMVVRWDLNDPDNGVLIAKVEGSVFSLAYNSSFGLLAVGQNQQGIRFINVADKKEVATVPLPKANYFDILFVENSVWVADGQGHLHLIENNVLVRSIAISTASLRKLQILRSDSNVLLIGASDGYIYQFDLKNEMVIDRFLAHDNSVFALSQLDDNILLSGSRDAKIGVWDIKAKFMNIQKIPAHLFAINDLVASPDFKYFFTCSMDKSIKIWSAQQLRLLKVVDKARHAGHGTSINKLLWFDKYSILVSASDDRSIGIWKINFE